jgi:hypothetical protein
VIITTDLSSSDVEELRERGVESLITITPPLSTKHPFLGADAIEKL